MNLFRRRTLPTKEQLFEPPKGGDPIVLDEEEIAIIQREGQGLVDGLKGYSWPTAVSDEINRGLTTTGLIEAAKSKLANRDFKGAATSCFKAAGIAVDDPHPWLMLAEVMVEYGDLARAEGLVKHAEEVAQKQGEGSRFKKELSQRVRDLIELRLVGVSGDEECVRWLQYADSSVNLGRLDDARNDVAQAEEFAREADLLAAIERSGVIQRVKKRIAKGR